LCQDLAGLTVGCSFLVIVWVLLGIGCCGDESMFGDGYALVKG